MEGVFQNTPLLVRLNGVGCQIAQNDRIEQGYRVGKAGRTDLSFIERASPRRGGPRPEGAGFAPKGRGPLDEGHIRPPQPSPRQGARRVGVTARMPSPRPAVCFLSVMTPNLGNWYS